MKGKDKPKCIVCEHFVARKHFDMKCWRCYRKGKHIINFSVPQSIEYALQQVREVKQYKGQSNAVIHVPPCLKGKKVKLILVEDDNQV